MSGKCPDTWEGSNAPCINMIPITAIIEKITNQFTLYPMASNINLYSNNKQLQNIISKKALPGKIFIGPLTSSETKNIHEWCSKGVIFFSFASDRKLASNCVYLINFFPLYM